MYIIFICFYRFTARITQLNTVLDDLNKGHYERTMVGDQNGKIQFQSIKCSVFDNLMKCSSRRKRRLLNNIIVYHSPPVICLTLIYLHICLNQNTVKVPVLKEETFKMLIEIVQECKSKS